MKKQKKKTVKNRMDKKWSLIIRSKGRCEVCGKDEYACQLHPHHVIGRRNLDTRWDIRNGVCLCAMHHTLGKESAHEQPLWFKDWLEKNRPEDYKYLNDFKKKKTKTFHLNDYLKIEEELNELISRLNI